MHGAVGPLALSAPDSGAALAALVRAGKLYPTLDMCLGSEFSANGLPGHHGHE